MGKALLTQRDACPPYRSTYARTGDRSRRATSRPIPRFEDTHGTVVPPQRLDVGRDDHTRVALAGDPQHRPCESRRRNDGPLVRRLGRVRDMTDRDTQRQRRAADGERTVHDRIISRAPEPEHAATAETGNSRPAAHNPCIAERPPADHAARRIARGRRRTTHERCATANRKTLLVPPHCSLR